MFTDNLLLIIGIALCILLPMTISRIYMKKITSQISDIDVLKSYYNKNKKILSIIGYCFTGYVILSLLLMTFIPSIKENITTFLEVNVYIMMTILAIMLFFVFNKQYLANKVFKK